MNDKNDFGVTYVCLRNLQRKTKYFPTIFNNNNNKNLIKILKYFHLFKLFSLIQFLTTKKQKSNINLVLFK